MARTSRSKRELVAGLAFLTPNIIGVATFVIFPVLFSLIMAFTNWDLTLHNMFKSGPESHVRFVGFDNFSELIFGDQFKRYLGNTLFLMMAIPFSVGASLFAAMLLSKDTRAGGGRRYIWLLSAVGLVVGCAMLAVAGAGATAMTILLVSVACIVMLCGVTGGMTFYRTLFYTPHFVAGVATFLLWTQLYSAETGPINITLTPLLDELTDAVRSTPNPLWYGLAWVGVVLMLLVYVFGTSKLRDWLVDGDVGRGAVVIPFVLLSLPVAVSLWWGTSRDVFRFWPTAVAVIIISYQVVRMVGRDFFPSKPSEGFGSAFVVCLMLMVVEFVLLGLSCVAFNLPDMATSGDGLRPPSWLRTDPEFAKPALMFMGFWAAIGSNNMLLYIAALTNVPQELYEAADIDGASRLQRFWNVTWPQLAPTTFFILVMSTIGGLQGGFEMARVMTQGGPAGATTTISYFIYTEGFETGRLGFACAVAWALFLLVFTATAFNWKFGNKYVND